MEPHEDMNITCHVVSVPDYSRGRSKRALEMHIKLSKVFKRI